MATEDHSQTFDSLVSGISTDERKTLLEKMKNGASAETSLLETTEAFDADEASIDFSTRIKQESLFLRLWLWIKSIFTSTSIEEVYNKSLVSQIARSVEHQTPGLINYHNQYLGNDFYGKLIELKHAADFFSGYIETYEKDTGSFYVLLGSLIMPQISDQMNTQADPYTYSLNKEINSEMRTSLLRKMDDILQSIPADKKAEMYACVRSVEWLRQFVKLPFEDLLSKFTSVVNDMNICSFDQVENEMSSFSHVLCSGKTIQDEVIEALYLFNRRKYVNDDYDDVETKSSGASFMDTAASQIAVIGTFISAVPMRSLCCVVYDNALYVPETFGGGEDWYVRYKAEWKKLFDRKWESWLRDCKKEKLKIRLMDYFLMANFPAFPVRPWTELWGGVPFGFEMTLGFINYFFKNQFVQYLKTLKIITLEGDFAIKDNRIEFNDTVNVYSDISDELDDLCHKLGPNGEYGVEFERYKDVKTQSKAAVQKINVLMNTIDEAAKTIISIFGDASRTMDKLLTGLLSDKIDSHYGNLTNIASIQGHDNKKFRQDLEDCKQGIVHALEIVKELEPLDKPIGE